MSIKDFTVTAKLGQGAYSSVYKVERLADHRVYALKKVKLGNLSQKQLQNSVNQVRILASISNANIIGYKQAFIDGKNLCVIMEFADGGDLYQKICQYKKNKKHFEETEIWNVLIQVTRGLKVLHDIKVFHRDLKSANVFLTRQGDAKLGDMNVSKIAKNGLLYTQTGTPYYASPEVWKDKPYDEKSDIWSFGCVIYEMTALQPPFKAEDMQSLFKTVTAGKYPPIPAFYSKQLASVIQLMLQQSPSNRPSTDKLIKSSLLSRKASQLNLSCRELLKPDLLKTIMIPKKMNYLTDRLPKSKYDSVKTSDVLSRPRRLTEDNAKNRQRQSTDLHSSDTLPKLEGLMRYPEQIVRRKDKQVMMGRGIRNCSLKMQGLSNLTNSEARIEMDKRQREDARRQMQIIHNIGTKHRIESYKAKYKGLPPLRR